MDHDILGAQRAWRARKVRQNVTSVVSGASGRKASLVSYGSIDGEGSNAPSCIRCRREHKGCIVRQPRRKKNPPVARRVGKRKRRLSATPASSSTSGRLVPLTAILCQRVRKPISPTFSA